MDDENAQDYDDDDDDEYDDDDDSDDDDDDDGYNDFSGRDDNCDNKMPRMTSNHKD